MASNSSLATVVMISPNKTVMKNKVNDTISIHCMAGQLSVESCGKLFAKKGSQASSNYGIGPDGRIAMYVEEKDRSWCTSNRANDQRAITIEVASDSKAPYAVTDAAYASLIKLLVDICKRNNIKKLLWQANKSLIGQVNKQNMTVHRWFANKACPGDYLYNKHYEIANLVNAQLGASAEQPKPVAEPTGTQVVTAVKVTVSSLNIRSGPGTKYAQVGVLKKNATVKIVEKSGSWGKIENNKGWISLNKSYVTEVPVSSVPAQTTAKPATAPTFKVGKVYKLQAELQVRVGAGFNQQLKVHSQLTKDGQKHDLNNNGALDKGTSVTCLEVKNEVGNIWIRCASGWICAYSNGTTYVK